MKNKICLAVLIAVFLITGSAFADESVNVEKSTISVTLDEKKIEENIMVVDGLSYVSIDKLANVMNMAMNWNNESRIIELESIESQMIEELEAENILLKELLLKNNIKLPTNGRIEKSAIDMPLLLNEYASVRNYEMVDNLSNSYSQSLGLRMTKGATLVFQTQGQYDVFRGTLFLNDNSFRKSPNENVYRYADADLKIIADEVLVFEKNFKYNQEPIDIEADILGAKEVTILCNFNVTGVHLGNVYIGNPKFIIN